MTTYNTANSLKLCHRPSMFCGFLATFSLILLTGLPLTSQEQPVDLTGVPAVLGEAEFAQIDTYITDAMASYSIPGATIAIVHDGSVVHTSAFGVRELGSDTPVIPDTRFMIGSLPKSMTSLMIGTLVDEGVLDWDTPVSDVFPAFALADAEPLIQ